MAPSSGDRLGHFEIVAPLGAGGMGEVYRARDTRLDREVAIKVLPEAVASDPERLARFEREARVLGSLNHPNIAHLYGLESVSTQMAAGTAAPQATPEASGPLVGRPSRLPDENSEFKIQNSKLTADTPESAVTFLVMELVEGEDLARRIVRGPLPVKETVEIGRQIADGLEAAHCAGIIHRDLKPGNIRITPDGTVKILDFGLAKEWGPSPGDVDYTESPTITAEMTRAGTVLGTAPYLSPEQALGKAVDRRADIWAFGCVLYEMLTGKRTFSGATSTEILAHILERDPEWDALPRDVSASLRRLLERCLEKDPKRRLRDAGDVALALEDLEVMSNAAPAAEAVSRSRPILNIMPWLIAAAAAALAIAGWIGKSPTTRPPPAPAVHFTQSSPAALDLARIGHTGSAVAISPDGSVLVWVGATSDGTQLYTRHLDEDEVRPIAGTEGGTVPFFSPDGEWIGFWADDKLKKVAVRGGAPQTICEMMHPHGASWGDGIIVVSAVGDGTFWRVDPSNGRIEQIMISNDPGYRGDYPHLLPDSRAMLVSPQGSTAVDLISLDTGEVKNLVNEGSSASYVASGHLVWIQGDNLLAAPFDLESRTITDEAHTVVQGVVSENLAGYTSHYAVSNQGTLVYLPGAVGSGGVRPTWVRLDGVGEHLPLPPEPSYLTPRVAPGGRRVLFSRQAETRSIWLAEPDRGVASPLTPDQGNQFWAIWTPDGDHMIFNSGQGNDAVSLWIQPIDLSTLPVRLTTAQVHHVPLDITRDGGRVLYISSPTLGTGSNFDIHLLDLEGESKSSDLLATAANEVLPALSPDNRWFAYASDATGDFEVYVQSFPNPGKTVRVSPNGGTEPLWSPAGDRLYYRSIDGLRVFAVDVAPGDPLRFGREEMLFEGNFPPAIMWGRKWDIHPDGDRFLMLTIESSESPPGIRVITNWFTELERLVPTTQRPR